MEIEAGYFGLFFSGFIAATIIPLTSEGVLLIMLALDYDPLTCLIVISLGNWLGGLSTYGLGYLGKESWLNKYFGISKEKVLRFKTSVNQYKIAFALLCWLPIVGDLFAAGLGYFKASFIPTAIFMLIGKTLRYAFIIYLFY